MCYQFLLLRFDEQSHNKIFQPLSQVDDLENPTDIDSIQSDNTQPLSDYNSDQEDSNNNNIDDDDDDGMENRIYSKVGIELTKIKDISKIDSQKEIQENDSLITQPSSQSTTSQFKLLPNFPFHETWPNWSSEALEKWPIFLSLALPSALSLFLEWGSYEVMAGFAGQLGTIPLATHGVFMNTASLAYNGPMAIADATSVLTGNYLGKNEPNDAKKMVLLGMMIDFCLGLITGSILLFVLRSYWGYLFTSDIEVIESVVKNMPYLFIYLIIDSMKCVTCNVIRSTGRPVLTTYGNIVCCVFIIIPLGYYTSITLQYDLIGIWLSMSVGWFVATVIYSYILYSTNWDEQAHEAYNRNKESSSREINIEVI